MSDWLFVSENQSGQERGIVMRNKKECYIESINFNLMYNSHDSMMYEINLYEYQEGVVDVINKNRIFLILDKNKKNHQINVRDQNIKVKGDFLISFEAIQVKGENWGIMFKSGCKSMSNLLIKENSGKWTEEKKEMMPAI